MEKESNDPVNEVVQNLPDMASGNEDKPAGTVVSGDGERVTLGEEVPNNTSHQSPHRGMNLRDMKF